MWLTGRAALLFVLIVVATSSPPLPPPGTNPSDVARCQCGRRVPRPGDLCSECRKKNRRPGRR